MTVRFILGRSGGGKTHHCLDSVLRHLVQCPDGPALILLVPDQATFQIEQALLADGRVGGFHRARVYSFSRLARQVVQETGPPVTPVLSESARRMVLRRLIQQIVPRLKIYSLCADRSGFIDQLAGMIRELRQYQKSPDDLRRQCETMHPGGSTAPDILADKLSDLAMVYQAYQDFITGRFVDPDDFLDLAASCFDQAAWLAGSHIWIDGFAGFTPQQLRTLLALIARAEKTEITLCLDPAADQSQLAESSSDPAALDPADLFHPTLTTYQKLLDLFTRHHIAVDPPLVPARSDSQGCALPRFQNSPTLARLERHFTLMPFNSPASAGDRNSSGSNSGRDQIVLVEAPDARREVEAVARRILQFCREQNYRFRDVAVILRDFQQYSDLIETVFEDHGIAYFMDQPRPIRHHPLVELIRGALEALVSGFDAESIFRYLRTGLAGLDHHAIDALENYVLAHGVGPARWLDNLPWPGIGDGVQGVQQIQNPKSKIQNNHDINRIRRQAIQPLLDLRVGIYSDSFDLQRPIPADRITTTIYHLLNGLAIRQTLTRWFHEAIAQGRPEDAQTHRQVWSAVVDLLNDAVLTLEQTAVTLEQYEQIITAALESMTLGLVPPRLDQVLVGAIERSRHPRVRAAFLLGVNEGRFPQSVRQDSLLTDDQRQKLLDNQFELAPTAVQCQLHENYLAYIAVTRPSDFLWVSYPVADSKGTLLCPSVLIEAVGEAAGGVPLQRLDAQSDPDPRAITNLNQLVHHLAAGLSPCQRPDAVATVDPIWFDLLRAAEDNSNWRDDVRRGLTGITGRNDAVIAPEIVASLYGPTLDVSVSRLESFAACPFQHFARYILRLAKRDELRLAAVDLGSFYHRALCEMFHRLQRAGLSWRDLDDGALARLVDETAGDILQHDPLLGEMRGHSARNSNVFHEARLRLTRFCRSLRAAARAGDFQQISAELKFGPGCAIPGLELKLDSDHTLTLHGVIDRVDTCPLDEDSLGVCLFDYKSAARPFEWGDYYHGLNLQLVSYLEVLRNHFLAEAGRIIPVAALYMPILHPGQSRSGPPPDELMKPDAAGLETEIYHKSRGVIASPWFQRLDHTVADKERSRFYGVYVDRNGSVENNNSRDIVKSGQMDHVLAHCRRTLIDLGRRMIRGDIAVKPYRLGDKTTPCATCDFQSLCRFDFSLDGCRFLSQYKKSEVLDRIDADFKP
jgi:ATP-dependent helicase/nuclease subunit B